MEIIRTIFCAWLPRKIQNTLCQKHHSSTCWRLEATSAFACQDCWQLVLTWPFLSFFAACWLCSSYNRIWLQACLRVIGNDCWLLLVNLQLKVWINQILDTIIPKFLRFFVWIVWWLRQFLVACAVRGGWNYNSFRFIWAIWIQDPPTASNLLKLFYPVLSDNAPLPLRPKMWYCGSLSAVKP